MALRGPFRHDISTRGGGFVAQAIVHARPNMVRKLVLAGTGPAGGEGISNVGAVLQDGVNKAKASGKLPKHFLFFTQTAAGQKAADEYVARLNERAQNRDKPVSNATILAQLTAIHAWGNGSKTPLESITHPVLVANGDHDIMVPTVNSFELARRLPTAILSIFPDSSHGGIFQYQHEFVPQTLAFLTA
jgi:pimeloyl-ACP methyl ester carboxylesterase